MSNQLLDHDMHVNAPFALNGTAKDYFLQTARWAKIVAIANVLFSIVFLLFIIIYMFLQFSLNTAKLPEEYQQTGAVGYKAGYAIGVTVMAVILFLFFLYPSVRLWQFAAKMKKALHTNNSEDLEVSIKRLRSVFRFYGIIILISVIFYLLALALSMLGVFPVA